MKGYIGFENHKISCIIGEREEERTLLQNIYVDLKVGFDFSRCLETDQLGDTVDYVSLADLCTRLAQVNQYQLIETFAGAVLQELKANEAIQSAWIRVKKANGLLSADYSYVELSIP